jgi:hypothetical protein
MPDASASEDSRSRTSFLLVSRGTSGEKTEERIPRKLDALCAPEPCSGVSVSAAECWVRATVADRRYKERFRGLGEINKDALLFPTPAFPPKEKRE